MTDIKRSAQAFGDTDSLGEPLAIVPLGYRFASLLVGVIALTAMILLFTAEFKRKVNLPGAVNSVSGQFNVFPLKNGYVTHSWVTEQMEVARGQRLFEVTAEVHTKSGGTIAELKTRIEESIESLKQEITRSSDIYEIEVRELTMQRAFLAKQQVELERQILLQKDISTTLFEQLEGQRDLVGKNFVSSSQMQTKEQEYSRALSDLSELEYSKHAIVNQQSSIAEQLLSFQLRNDNDIARLEREIASYQQQLFELEIQSEKIVVAPEEGVITAISINTGESIQSDTLAMVIIPKHAIWQVEVYATSSEVGFIRPSNPAKLRYEAYPYQRFGLYEGVVKHVSRAALRGSEIDSRLPPSEYYYKVTIELNEQCIVAYGKCEPLQSGMGVIANIETERRNLIEWALDPLYTISGKI